MGDRPENSAMIRAIIPAAATAAALCSFTMAEHRQLPAENSFAVQGARVFDGERDLGVMTVIVQDGIVHALGANTRIPAGMETVDGTGHTLLPGFIDSHTHSFGSASQDAVRFGVTAQLDMLGDRTRLAAIERQRGEVGETGEADLWSAGAAVTAAGGHGTQYGMDVPALDADDDAGELVRQLAAEGSDYVKIIVEDMSAYDVPQLIPRLTPQQVRDAIVAAHEQSLMAVVHVSLQEDARHAISSGADGLVHIFADQVADDDFVSLVARRNAFVIPTLAVIAGIARSGEARQLAQSPALQPYMSAEQRSSLSASFPAEPRQRDLENAIESVRRLHAAGVSILAGSDAPNPGTAHGVSIHHELELLVRAGLSNREALAAATSVPASRFSLPDRGRIAPGARADLVLVRGNPLEDITATRTVARVWKNGYPVQREITAVALNAEQAPDATLVSSFDGDAVDAAFGAGWMGTNDQMAGGSSVDAHRLVQGGAQGSSGALEVSGEVRAGFAFPWSGVIYFPSSAPMQPIDLSSRRELVFHARGDGRTYNVMLFSGPSMSGMPSIQTFVAGPEWQEVTLQLAAFPGADLTLVRGIAFTAGQPAGEFRFLIDEVEIR